MNRIQMTFVHHIVESQQSALHARGLHGIPLIKHAEMSGKQAGAVLE